MLVCYVGGGLLCYGLRVVIAFGVVMVLVMVVLSWQVWFAVLLSGLVSIDVVLDLIT